MDRQNDESNPNQQERREITTGGPDAEFESAEKASSGDGRIPPDLLKAIDDRSEDVLVRMVKISRYFSGPLPPAEEIKKYEELRPGFVEVFFENFKSQTPHRQYLERLTVTGNVKAQSQGQWMAFILFLICIVGGIWLVATGREIPGAFTAIAGVLGPITLFLRRRSATDRSLTQKETDE